MKRSERYKYILEHFANTMPQVTTELEFGNVFQLLIATMLSAQCTDKRVNIVTKSLFKDYPDAHSLAQAKECDIISHISSISYPNSKARHIIDTAKTLINRYNGEIPNRLPELEDLPGVGRKTANVILAVGFGKAAMPVDTHVFRVSHRLGLVPKNCTTPLSVERYLRKNIKDDIVADAHHWLLLHGRYICTSRKPKCNECPFRSFCPELSSIRTKKKI